MKWEDFTEHIVYMTMAAEKQSHVEQGRAAAKYNVLLKFK